MKCHTIKMLEANRWSERNYAPRVPSKQASGLLSGVPNSFLVTHCDVGSLVIYCFITPVRHFALSLSGRTSKKKTPCYPNVFFRYSFDCAINSKINWIGTWATIEMDCNSTVFSWFSPIWIATPFIFQSSHHILYVGSKIACVRCSCLQGNWLVAHTNRDEEHWVAGYCARSANSGIYALHVQCTAPHNNSPFSPESF